MRSMIRAARVTATGTTKSQRRLKDEISSVGVAVPVWAGAGGWETTVGTG
jgi:hypothetical protein